MKPDRSCENCTAGVFKKGEVIGECRHRPPQPMLQPFMRENKLTGLPVQEWAPVAFFPPVKRDSWCRNKFEARVPVPGGPSQIHENLIVS